MLFKAFLIFLAFVMLFSVYSDMNTAEQTGDAQAAVQVAAPEINTPSASETREYYSGEDFWNAINRGELTAPAEKLAGNALLWAKTGVKYQYLLNNNTQAHESVVKLIKRVSAADRVYPEFSDAFTLHATVCAVDFVPWGSPNDNLEQQPEMYYNDHYYRAHVLVISAEKDGVATCIAIRYPGEYREEALNREVYKAALRTADLKADLKPMPKEDLPEGFSVVPLKEAIGNHNVQNEYRFTLSNDVLAAVYYDAIGSNHLYRIGAVLFDRAGKLLKDVLIDERKLETYGDVETVDGKLNLYIHTPSADGKNSTYTRYIVDATGTVTKEENENRWAFRAYSPDGKQYAYAEKNCVYVVGDGGERKLIEGKYSEEYIEVAYHPLQWLDSRRLLLTIFYYEAGADIGILDTETGKIVGGLPGTLKRISDGKLYTICDGYEEDGSVWVYDTNKPDSKAVMLVKPESDGRYANWYNWGMISPDCKTAVFFLHSTEDTPNNLYVYSLEDGRKTNDISFYKSGFDSPVIFFENNLAGVMQYGNLLLIDLSKITDKQESTDSRSPTMYYPPEGIDAGEGDTVDLPEGEHQTDGNAVEGFYHKSLTEFNEAVMLGKYTAPAKELDKAACLWAQTAANFRYLYNGTFDEPIAGYDYASTKATKLSDSTFRSKSGNYVLHATECLVEMRAQIYFGHYIVKNTDGKITTKVTVISAEKDGIVRCIGVAYQNETEGKDLRDVVYEQAGCYPSY